MNKLLLILGYAIIIFAFLDFGLSWVYPDLLFSYYSFTYDLLGSFSMATPIILYFLGNFLVKFASEDNDDSENLTD